MGLKILAQSASIWLCTILPALSQSYPIALQKPLEVDLLQADSKVNSKEVIRGDNISVISVQVPSLWWTKEQFDPFAGRLISNWLIYPQKQGVERRVDILVNPQLWGLLDYIDRYTLVHKFGTVGRQYAYNIRFFGNQQQLLAAYTCNSPAEKPTCNLWIEPSAQDSLRRRPKR